MHVFAIDLGQQHPGEYLVALVPKKNDQYGPIQYNTQYVHGGTLGTQIRPLTLADSHFLAPSVILSLGKKVIEIDQKRNLHQH